MKIFRAKSKVGEVEASHGYDWYTKENRVFFSINDVQYDMDPEEFFELFEVIND